MEVASGHCCCRVTVVKDKESRRSKGVAFVLYIDRDSAFKCVHSLNKTQVNFAFGNRVTHLAGFRFMQF